jgi:multicomponent Na+:H+ antiporter subunit F
MSWDAIHPQNIVYAMLIAALLITFGRLAFGPSLPDRVVALDLITAITVGFMAAYAVDVGQEAFIDVALVVALVAFLGTVAFAQYIERRARDD